MATPPPIFHTNDAGLSYVHTCTPKFHFANGETSFVATTFRAFRSSFVKQHVIVIDPRPLDETFDPWSSAHTCICAIQSVPPQSPFPLDKPLNPGLESMHNLKAIRPQGAPSTQACSRQQIRGGKWNYMIICKILHRLLDSNRGQVMEPRLLTKTGSRDAIVSELLRQMPLPSLTILILL